MCEANTLTISVTSSEGVVGLGSTSSEYGNGASVSESCGSSFWIFAEPDSGYQFVSWSVSGDASVESGGAGVTILTMGATSGSSATLTLNLGENCVLPSGATIEGPTPMGVYCWNALETLSDYLGYGGSFTVGNLVYAYYGPQLGSYPLTNVNYNGPVVPLTVLTTGTIASQGSWCEDSSYPTPYPSMIVNTSLTTVGESGITDWSPASSWTYGSAGTVTVNVGLQEEGVTAGVSYSYNIPALEGELFEYSGYQNYAWQQGINTGGCPQAVNPWSFAETVLSAANSGTSWPSTTFSLNQNVTGGFNTCVSSLLGYCLVSAYVEASLHTPITWPGSGT